MTSSFLVVAGENPDLPQANETTDILATAMVMTCLILRPLVLTADPRREFLPPILVTVITLSLAVASVTPLTKTLLIPGQLKSALSEYVARLEGVKLLRSNKRLGAVRARVLGATRAAGDVLVFMDSHCECHPGWLEPLLSRIAGDR